MNIYIYAKILNEKTFVSRIKKLKVFCNNLGYRLKKTHNLNFNKKYSSKNTISV